MLITLAVTMTIVLATVIFHYLSLRVLTTFVRLKSGGHRTKIIVIIFSILSIHVVEVMWFAAGLWFTATFIGGTLHGLSNAGFLDYYYYSATTYSTAGYGDVLPVGPIRFLSEAEQLDGILLLGWSVSFTYLAMQAYWDPPRA